MNTGEIRQFVAGATLGAVLSDGFVPVSPYVAEAQLTGQRVLASKALRRQRKAERQNRKRGRS